MRTIVSFLLVLLLCTVALVPPALAQESAPQAGGATSVFLPMVSAGGETEGEAMLPGVVTVGTEPLFAASPKPVSPTEPIEPPLQPAEPDGAKAEEAAVEAAAMDGWATITNQTFEGVFPAAGWSVYDANGATGGDLYWDDDDYKPFNGAWSAWAGNGGANGLDPLVSNYRNDMRSVMVYGPFSLADASAANLTFDYWNLSELNYDWFGWFASPNNVTYYGNWVSGSSGGWRPGVIDFSSVPGYGSMLGDSSVWIMFYFYTDVSIVNKGTFVDNVFVQKQNCPGQYQASWYNGRIPNGQLTATTCESWPFSRSWGSGGPLFTTADNFSLRLSGTPYFGAGGYYFTVTTDDGVRVYLDNALIINAWVDQAAHTYTVYRTPGAGYHTVRVEYYENTGVATLAVNWYQ